MPVELSTQSLLVETLSTDHAFFSHLWSAPERPGRPPVATIGAARELLSRPPQSQASMPELKATYESHHGALSKTARFEGLWRPLVGTISLTLGLPLMGTGSLFTGVMAWDGTFTSFDHFRIRIFVAAALTLFVLVLVIGLGGLYAGLFRRNGYVLPEELDLASLGKATDAKLHRFWSESRSTRRADVERVLAEASDAQAVEWLFAETKRPSIWAAEVAGALLLPVDASVTAFVARVDDARMSVGSKGSPDVYQAFLDAEVKAGQLLDDARIATDHVRTTLAGSHEGESLQARDVLLTAYDQIQTLKSQADSLTVPTTV